MQFFPTLYIYLLDLKKKIKKKKKLKKKKIGPVVPRMCTIVFAVKFRYILTYRKPYFEFCMEKPPFWSPHRPPVGPPKKFCKWANLDPETSQTKKI